MSFWGNVKKFFLGVGAKVSAFFVIVLGQKAAKAIGEATIEALNTVLGGIVQDACIAVMTLQIGSEQKRKEAFKQIVTNAQLRGLQYSTSVINLLIELAVQRLKENVVPIK